MKKWFDINSADGRVRFLLAVWWVINILQATFTGLANDEAYYWMFAQKLGWGYFDHPPMTPLLVWLGNVLGGELGIRLFTTILQPLYLYILWTFVRGEKPAVGDASLFCMIAAAMPVMQLYGFIAVPDAPLMMFTALFLLCYNRFCKRENWTNVLLLGLSMALLAYSKYHGALVVALTLMSNPRILLRPKLYVSGLFTLLLFTPHLLWQSQHDWASFAYHLSGRNGYFKWSYISEFWLNLFAVFNPFYFPLFFLGWKRFGQSTAQTIRRALLFITAGFVIFFTFSALRGYVQPQWVIPITFGLVMILFGYVRDNERLRRYVMRVGWITLALIALVRIEMVTGIVPIRYEIFNNESSYSQIDSLAAGRPVIFGKNYSVAAKYMYYTGREAYCQPNINYRTSQWQFRDDDTRAAGRRVIIETSAESATDSLRLNNGYLFRWNTIDSFRPVRLVNVAVSGGVPELVRVGEVLTLDLTISNPYDYSISVSPDSLPLAAVWGKNKQQFHEYVLDERFVIGAGESVDRNIEITVPDLPEDEWRMGFVLKYDRMGYWFAGREYKIKIEHADR